VIISVSNDELGSIAAALQCWGDQLAEMSNDKALTRHPDDQEAKRWAEEEGHRIDRLHARMMALYAITKPRPEYDMAIYYLQELDNLTV
jgi:hypothetical protein